MSILPSKNQDSTSSSSSSIQSPIPKPNHGIIYSSPILCQSKDSTPPIHNLSGQVAPATGYSSGSSKEVNGRERRNHGKTPIHHNGGKTLQPKAASQSESGTSEHQEKLSENHIVPSPSSVGSTGRKAQMVSGNHLLNFHYDPIPTSRTQPRAPHPPARRQQKRRPYNKDLFFQANYKFVVLDSGNYAPESMDPDKMLNWEDVVCLKYCTPFPVHCPICLDDPLCPQITSCGHIFCFPCILQYFYMGEDDHHRGETWRKCPLCFAMISSKDLYTICIENVKQFRISDEIDFVLLTRQKDLFTSSLKNNERVDIDDDEIVDSFSKFTLTSDVELSVREAMSDLDNWIARADSGLVDDIEKLPYVCAAMEQLEQRKKHWNQQAISNENSTPDRVIGEMCLPQVADVTNESLSDHGRSSSSYDDAQIRSNGFKDIKCGDSYYFYQAVDGQHLILHPFNMKCLLHYYGSYERLPNRISGKILQLETVTQSEAMRRRYRFLSHFSLTTTFQLCEIDMSEMLPAESLLPFMDEIKNRENQRKRLAKKELKNKMKAEIAGSQFVAMPYYSYDGPPSFSMDDFEALGTPCVPSSSSIHRPVVERQSFSSVARLGFAAAHDSPDLKAPLTPNDPPTGPTGLRNVGESSFAHVTSSRPKPVVDVSNANEVVAAAAGKKGKRQSRVLMSTAGGRRY